MDITIENIFISLVFGTVVSYFIIKFIDLYRDNKRRKFNKMISASKKNEFRWPEEE